MYNNPMTQSTSRTIPAPKMAAPMFLPMKVSIQEYFASRVFVGEILRSRVMHKYRRTTMIGIMSKIDKHSRHDPVYAGPRTPSVP